MHLRTNQTELRKNSDKDGADETFQNEAQREKRMEK